MSNEKYSYDFIRSYIDENGNKILVYKITDLSYGISCTIEGIHEHKIKRKGIKKLNKQVKEQEAAARTKK